MSVWFIYLEIACKIERTKADPCSFVSSHVALKAQRERQNQSALLTLQSVTQYFALKWNTKWKYAPHTDSLSEVFCLAFILLFVINSSSLRIYSTVFFCIVKPGINILFLSFKYMSICNLQLMIKENVKGKNTVSSLFTLRFSFLTWVFFNHTPHIPDI